MFGYLLKIDFQMLEAVLVATQGLYEKRIKPTIDSYHSQRWL
jgi:hypothetical protein